eukprot:2599296-Pyramimonas_sp.AAC.1
MQVDANPGAAPAAVAGRRRQRPPNDDDGASAGGGAWVISAPSSRTLAMCASCLEEIPARAPRVRR